MSWRIFRMQCFIWGSCTDAADQSVSNGVLNNKPFCEPFCCECLSSEMQRNSCVTVKMKNVIKKRGNFPLRLNFQVNCPCNLTPLKSSQSFLLLPPWRGGLYLGVAAHSCKKVRYLGNISLKLVSSCFSWLITEWFGVGGDLWRWCSPNPLLKQVHLEQVVEDLIQDFAYPEKKQHNVSGQPVSVLWSAFSIQFCRIYFVLVLLFLFGVVFAPIEYSHNHKPSLMVTKCYLFMFICFLLAFIASVSFGMWASLLLKQGFQERELKLQWGCI